MFNLLLSDNLKNHIHKSKTQLSLYDVVFLAVVHNDLPAIQYIHKNKIPITWNVALPEQAAFNGNLLILKYLCEVIDKDFVNCDSILEYAILGNKKECVDYCLSTGFSTRRACDIAIEINNMEMLKYLISKHCPLQSKIKSKL